MGGLSRRGAPRSVLFRPAPKAPLLRRDLVVLGLVGSEIAALPRCPLVPQLPTGSAALGSLYVGEGATLGGQLILRSIAARLDIEAGSGAAFFASYGANVGPMWRAMKAELAGLPAADGGRTITGFRPS